MYQILNITSVGCYVSRAYRGILLLCLLIAVSGCVQTPDETLKLENNNASSSESAPGSENIGKGKTLVTMLLNRSGSLANGNGAVNYRDGAVLAIKDLGTDLITLSIRDTKSDVSTIGVTVNDAISKNTSMFIIGGSAQLINNAISFTYQEKKPIIALGADSLGTKAGVYTFQPDGIDTLHAGIKYAAAIGKKKLVIILSASQPQPDIRRIKKYAMRHASLIGTIVHQKGKAPKAFVTQHQKLLSSADVVVFAGKNHLVSNLISPIQSIRGKTGATLFIGRADWPSSVWLNAANSGIIVASPDGSSLGLVRGRFEEEYKRPMPISAAYAYDVIAIASGLARIGGAKSISRANLQKKSGFRGATGVFRLNSDGSVERTYRISKSQQGKLITIQKAPAGF